MELFHNFMSNSENKQTKRILREGMNNKFFQPSIKPFHEPYEL